MKRVSQHILIGALMFVIGGLVFGSRAAVGIAPCATVTPTLTPTLPATLTFSSAQGTQDDPIPLGQVTDEQWKTSGGDTEDFDIAVTQVIIGDKAVAKIKQANSFNSDPPDGSTYMLAYVQAQYVKGPKTAAGKLSSVQFEALSDKQLVQNSLGLVAPKPEIDFTGFPGAKFKGWVALMVFSDDQSPEIAIGVNTFDGSGGVYFATK